MKEKFPELTELVGQWREQGFETFHAYFRGCPEGRYAVEIVEYDIKTCYPDCTIVEYKAEVNEEGTYIIVKCIKKSPHEKSKD